MYSRAAMDDFFYKVKRQYPTIDDDLKAIFVNAQKDSPQRTMTLSEIRAAYRERTGEDFPVKGSPRNQMYFILTIPHVACFTNPIGTMQFFTIKGN